MAERGIVTNPRVTFWDGDEVFLITYKPVNKGNAKYWGFYMLLTEYVRWRYDITDDMLDYSLDSQGILYREYPQDLIEFISFNPENTVIWAYCYFDGTEVLSGLVAELKNRIKRQNDTITRLNSQLTSLEAQAKALTDRIRLLERKRIQVD